MANYRIISDESINDDVSPLLGDLITKFIDKDKGFTFETYNHNDRHNTLTISARVSIYKKLCHPMRKKKSLFIDNQRALEVIEFNDNKYVLGSRKTIERDSDQFLKQVFNEHIGPRIEYLMPFMSNSIEYNVKKMSDLITKGINVDQNTKTINLLNGLCDHCSDKIRCAMKNGKVSRR